MSAGELNQSRGGVVGVNPARWPAEPPPKTPTESRPATNTQRPQHLTHTTHTTTRRWIHPDGSARTPPPGAFLPFGHGVRVCPGSELAQLEALACAATILRDFELRWPDGHPKASAHARRQRQIQP